MKKDANESFIFVNSPEFDKAIKFLIYFLQGFYEQDAFGEMNTDLLQLAMTELIVSNTFSNLPEARKRELFDQYNDLRMLLERLDIFLTEHPCGKKEDTIRVECKPKAILRSI